jgi:hypothetical protein
MHKYLVKYKKCKKWVHKFYKQFDMYSCMNVFLHMLPTLGATNLKPNVQKIPNCKRKNHFPCNLFGMDYVAFKILVSCIIQSNALCEHYQTQMYALFIHERKLKSMHYLIHSFLFL